MLVHLSVEDLGLIEQVEFDPSGGLHVLTGETGVGKSMPCVEHPSTALPAPGWEPHRAQGRRVAVR